MSIAPDATLPAPLVMEVEDTTRLPASTNFPCPSDSVIPASSAQTTSPLNVPAVRNVQEERSSIGFLLNTGQEPFAASGGSTPAPQTPPRAQGPEMHVPVQFILPGPHGLVPPSATYFAGHTTHTTASRSPFGPVQPPWMGTNHVFFGPTGNNLFLTPRAWYPGNQYRTRGHSPDQTVFPSYPPRAAASYAVPHGVPASPGGRSILSEHDSPRSFIGGHSIGTVANPPSTPSVASQSPVTPAWDSPALSSRFEEASSNMGQSQYPRSTDDRSEPQQPDEPTQFELPPSSGSRYYAVQRQLDFGRDASLRPPKGTPDIEARRAFESADCGSKGFLDFKNFQEAIKYLEVPLGYHQALICFFCVLNAQHTNGRISEADFVNGYLNNKFSMTPRR